MIMTMTTTANNRCRRTSTGHSASAASRLKASGRGSKNAVPESRITGTSQRNDGSNRNFNNSVSKAIKTIPKAVPRKAPNAMTTTSTMTMPTKLCVECSRQKTNESETWDEMLSVRTKATESDESPDVNSKPVCFLQFDPYRTLVFLFHELKSKLKTTMPTDKTLRRILHEMKNSMKRMEKESEAVVSNGGSDQNSIEENCVKHRNASNQTHKYQIRCYDKSAQTDCEPFACSIQCVPDEDVCYFQKKRYASKPHIDERASVKESERSPSRAEEKHRRSPNRHRSSTPKDNSRSPRHKPANDDNSEHDANIRIRDDLSRCREEIATLKAQVACLQNQLEQTSGKEACIIQQLENRCKLLRNELKTLKDIVKKQSDELAIIQNLSAKFKESSSKVHQLEKSRLETDRILTFTKLEKEKLAILQTFQEKRIAGLQSEVNNLCKLARQQLEEMHSTTSTSSINDLDIMETLLPLTSSKPTDSNTKPSKAIKMERKASLSGATTTACTSQTTQTTSPQRSSIKQPIKRTDFAVDVTCAGNSKGLVCEGRLKKPKELKAPSLKCFKEKTLALSCPKVKKEKLSSPDRVYLQNVDDLPSSSRKLKQQQQEQQKQMDYKCNYNVVVDEFKCKKDPSQDPKEKCKLEKCPCSMCKARKRSFCCIQDDYTMNNDVCSNMSPTCSRRYRCWRYSHPYYSPKRYPYCYSYGTSSSPPGLSNVPPPPPPPQQRRCSSSRGGAVVKDELSNGTAST